MPYSKDNPPDWLKSLPAGAQAIGIETFNKVLGDSGDEEKARIAAWTAIKAKYEKRGDEWVEMKGPSGEALDVEIVHMAASVEAPAEFMIFPFGKVEGTGMEPFTVDKQSVESCRMFHESLGRDMVVDYEHQTLSGGVAPAAGWIKQFFDNGQNALCCGVEWTGRAREFIKNREYRYFSPVALLSKGSRHLVAINTMALTNNPRGHNLTPLVMKAVTIFSSTNPPTNQKEGVMLKKIIALLGLPEGTTEDGAIEAMKSKLDDMKLTLEAASVLGAATAKEIMSALGLKPDAAIQEIVWAIHDLKSKAQKTADPAAACAEVMSELGLQAAAGKSEVIATIRALKQAQSQGVSAAEFEAMKQKLAEREAGELVAEAMKAGKITAAQKDWAAKYARDDPEGFSVFVEKAPVVVSMKAIEDKEVLKDPVAGLSQEDREIMKMLDLSEADFKKYYKQATA